MSWKDWLYIPKGDKIAIICLIALILLLFFASIVINHKQNKKRENVSLTYSKDYEKWKNQLILRKEEEKQTYYKEYKKYYPNRQLKMKLGETIELNSADTTLLKTIPGIGSGYANRIVNYREKLGGFAKIEQLNEVWGMDTYLYSQIVPFIALEANYDFLYINKDSFEKLLSHPYLNYKQVLAIDDIRKRKGAIKSLKRLSLLDEFTRRDIELLSIYANFDEK